MSSRLQREHMHFIIIILPYANWLEIKQLLHTCKKLHKLEWIESKGMEDNTINQELAIGQAVYNDVRAAVFAETVIRIRNILKHTPHDALANTTHGGVFQR